MAKAKRSNSKSTASTVGKAIGDMMPKAMDAMADLAQKGGEMVDRLIHPSGGGRGKSAAGKKSSAAKKSSTASKTSTAKKSGVATTKPAAKKTAASSKAKASPAAAVKGKAKSGGAAGKARPKASKGRGAK
jgi:hypothetical protein